MHCWLAGLRRIDRAPGLVLPVWRANSGPTSCCVPQIAYAAIGTLKPAGRSWLAPNSLKRGMLRQTRAINETCQAARGHSLPLHMSHPFNVIHNMFKSLVDKSAMEHSYRRSKCPDLFASPRRVVSHRWRCVTRLINLLKGFVVRSLFIIRLTLRTRRTTRWEAFSCQSFLAQLLNLRVARDNINSHVVSLQRSRLISDAPHGVLKANVSPYCLENCVHLTQPSTSYHAGTIPRSKFYCRDLN